jgi:ribose transport system ATP-binding protein
VAGALIEMRDVTMVYGGTTALDGALIAVDAGEIHAVVGENGAGKSTLMRILAGAENADSGEILVGGTPMGGGGPRAAAERGITMVFQEMSLAGNLTVAENIVLGRLPRRRGMPVLVDWRRSREQAERAVARLGVRLPLDARVSTLSLATQQMIEIAKALSTDVRVLILDEPTSSLAETEVHELFRVLRDLREQGVTVLYISHNLEEIFALCDRITVLRDGRTIGSRAVSETNPDELIQMMVGRTLTEMLPKQDVPCGAEALRVEDLVVPGRASPVSFTVHSGEVLGFAGLLGAGRTALMRTIIGAIRAESGRIYLNGSQIRVPNPGAAIRQGIGYLSDDRRTSGIVGGLSVRNNIGLSSLPGMSTYGLVSGRQERAIAERFVNRLHVTTPSIEQQVRFLSGGNQQKVVLGKSLAAGVRVLILDEPTRGIDVGAKVDVYQLINELAADGVAVILVSSYLPEVLGMSDRIAVLRNGELVRELSRKDATAEAVMYAATGQEPARLDDGSAS